MACRALIDRCLARLAGLARMSVDGDVRRDVALAQGLHEGSRHRKALSAPRVMRRSPGRWPSIRSRAVSRSAVPVAWRDPANDGRPLRFSISAWPMIAELGSPGRRPCGKAWRRGRWCSRASRSSASPLEVAFAVAAARAGSPSRPSGGSSSSRPRPRSACRPPRSDRSTRASLPAAGPAGSPGTSRATSPSRSRSRFFVNTVAIPDRIIHRQTDEPAEQKIVVDLLHQLALRAHREERLQQRRPQQLLRRDRGPSDLRIKRVKSLRQPGQRLVHQRPDRPAADDPSRSDPPTAGTKKTLPTLVPRRAWQITPSLQNDEITISPCSRDSFSAAC